jgi:hypothetical protein
MCAANRQQRSVASGLTPVLEADYEKEIHFQ